MLRRSKDVQLVRQIMHDGNELEKAKLDFCLSDEENGKFILKLTRGQQM